MTGIARRRAWLASVFLSAGLRAARVFVVTFLLVAPCATWANMVRGFVAYRGSCGYLAIQTTMGYTVVEDYGALVFQGETVVGQLHMYGFTQLYVLTRDTNGGQVWVDDFWLSRDRTLQKLLDKGCR
jgi:hypothetical protein